MAGGSVFKKPFRDDMAYLALENPVWDGTQEGHVSGVDIVQYGENDQELDRGYWSCLKELQMTVPLWHLEELVRDLNGKRRIVRPPATDAPDP